MCFVDVFVRGDHVSSSIVLTTSGVRCALLPLLPSSRFSVCLFASVILNVVMHCGTCSALTGRVS